MVPSASNALCACGLLRVSILPPSSKVVVSWLASDLPCTSSTMAVQTHSSLDGHSVVVFFVLPNTRSQWMGLPRPLKVSEIATFFATCKCQRQHVRVAGSRDF